MVKAIHITAASILVYSTVVFSCSESQIPLQFGSYTSQLVPRNFTWAIYLYALLFFYLGGLFLTMLKPTTIGQKIEIWGKEITITKANQSLVRWGLNWTTLGMLLSLGFLLIPNLSLGIDHIQMLSPFIIGACTSIIPSIIVRRKISKLTERVS